MYYKHNYLCYAVVGGTGKEHPWPQGHQLYSASHCSAYQFQSARATVLGIDMVYSPPRLLLIDIIIVSS
jgi:hypothetical protein